MSTERNPLRRPDRLSDDALVRVIEDARDELVQRHTGLVLDIVAEHEAGQPKAPLAQVGMIATLEAVRYYRPADHGPLREWLERAVRASIDRYTAENPAA